MKRVFLYLIFLLISMNLVLGVTVTRDMPSSTDSDKNIIITLNIQNAEVGSLFSLVETVPSQFSIVDWVVNGSTESQDKILTITNNVYNWSLTPTKADPWISYSVSIPKTANGQYSFYTSWSSEDETGTDQRSVNVISVKSEVKAEDAWSFSEKKKKNPFVTVLAVLAVLGLTGYGVYGIIQRKKGKKLDIKIPKIRKPLKTVKKDIEQPETADKDYVEKFGSELPSFKDESTLSELPSLEEHKKELQKEPEQKPPPPVETAEEPKKEEIHEDYKKKVDDIDELFDKVFKKEKEK